MNLEPIDPETAFEMYLTDKQNELSAASLEAHDHRLRHFVRWCGLQSITNLNELTGRRLHEFRLWRREENGLNKVSEKTQMDTLRVFIRWLETIDAVENDLSLKVRSPSITPEENARDVMLHADRANDVLDYCRKYKYSSCEHITLTLLWHSMMRTGAVHALDVRDYHPEEKFLKLRHRPDTGTPIKNKSGGERMIALSDDVCDLLDDWITDRRPDSKDNFGRDPLLATNRGRISKGTIRQYVYRNTRPCSIGDECPHDREPAECEAVESGTAGKCPSSVSPHAIRRGSITHSLNSDVPDTVVSDRANVSKRVIAIHYDRRTEREKMEQRREYLDNL